MRQNDVKVGQEYLTRTVRIVDPLGGRRYSTQGHVRVIGWSGNKLVVLRLMRDGSERTTPGLPRLMPASALLTPVG